MTIDILLGFVKLGMALFTNKSSPFFLKESILGVRFNFDASSKYSFWLPSKQITIAVDDGMPGYCRSLISMGDDMIQIF